MKFKITRNHPDGASITVQISVEWSASATHRQVCEAINHVIETTIKRLDTEIPITPTKTSPYPPNVKCCCGELIHPDMPNVEVEADGGLFHWNDEGGGHRFDASV